MKYNFTPLLTLFSAALIGGMAPSYATDETAPDTISGKYCVSAGSAIQLLAAKQNPDKTLDFGLSVWFENGQQCGVIGKAKPSAGGWRYEENIDSENEEERCGITFNAVNGTITVNADEQASCRFACGGGAAIADLQFPPQSQESKKASSGLFDPETLYNTTCQPQP